MALRFLLGQELKVVEPSSPTETLLGYLRRGAHRPGTKEGCAEGDCGACTVVIGDLAGGALRYRAVNSCIQFLGACDGRQVITVEDLGAADGRLHPVQQAMVDAHASQCGFCTPGFVMSLFAQYRNAGIPGGEGAGVEDMADALAGNLCRCTGYGPILAAAAALQNRHPDQFDAGREETIAALRGISPVAEPASGFFAPHTVDALARLCLQHPSATLVAGSTDVGLWVTKLRRQLGTLIFLGNVAGLQEISETDDELLVGAGVTYATLKPVLARHWPDFAEVVRRLGSAQIRNVATIGGNIANGSPIGDGAPCLIALGARLVLRAGDARREIPLEDFFIAYGRQDRREGEFIEAIRIKKPLSGGVFRAYKVSKRFDQDISALLGAFHLRLDGGQVTDIRIAFGGMAATPRRALRTEAALLGMPWNETTIAAASAMLAEDYQPIGDMRASATYRAKVAGNLLRKCFIETTRPELETRVVFAGRGTHG